jgi:hypothetical protein
MTGVLALTPTSFASTSGLLAVAGFGASLAKVVIAPGDWSAHSLRHGARHRILPGSRPERPQTIGATLRTVVIADYVLTATAAIAQLLTGLTIVRLGSHDLGQTRLGASLALYLLIGACWLPVVYLQIRMRDLVQAAVAAERGSYPKPIEACRASGSGSAGRPSCPTR